MQDLARYSHVDTDLGQPLCGGKKTTPAMAAGVARAPWSFTQLAEMLD